MPSCECCWNSRGLSEPSEAYLRALREHEDRGCVCTKHTEEGRKARAGQFWQDGRDVRYTPEEWAAYVGAQPEQERM